MKNESKFQSLCWRACIALCLAIALVLPAIAQNPYGDPSGRVARLNFIQGEVSLQPGGEDDWVWASVNRPLTTYDSIWTGSGSKAELHVGSTAIRVAPRTSFSFLNLDDDAVQIELNSGTMNIRVRNLDRDDVFEVDTPNIAFSLLQRGEYRVTVDPEGTFTTVTVRSGEGQINGGGQAFYVDAGSQVQVAGTDYITYDVYDLPDRDYFDRWAYLRDAQENRSRSVRYVSPEMTGYEDLDRYGTWRTDPNLGPIWMPTRVSSNWAPYRNGHWAWVDPWGWTWVDDAQFGFVTSHYGRWAFVDNGYGQGSWAWVPPRREQNTYQRVVYAPALVTFVSTPTQDVVWAPLAPGEVYVPSYRASTNYVTRVNVTNTVVQQQTITTVVSNPQQAAPSRNQQVANAVTAVPKTAFVSAQPVATAAVKVDQKTVAAARPAPAAPVAPVKTSVVQASAPPAKAAAPAPKPPAAVVSRPVVAKATPPPPPVPFEKKQQALAATPGKPLDPKVEQNLRATAPAPKPVIAAQPATVKPAAETPKKPQPAVSPNEKKLEHPATPATGAPPPGQQRAEEARQQAAQRQAEQQKQQQLAAQQQAEKEKAQQLAAQERADKEKAQQEAALAKQQAAQQQAEKERAQQQAAQQQAEKQKAEQLAAQQQAEKQKAQQQAAQAQQEAQRARQQAAQQQAEKEKAQQLAAQQQAEKERAQQQAAQQQAEKEKAQQLAAQQQAEQARGRERQQIAEERAPGPPGKQPNARLPGKAPEAQASAGPLRVPENEQSGKLISQPKLNVPANAQNIHGVVRMRVLIGTDGKVKNVTVFEGPQGGPPQLQAAAMENVRRRVYQPTLLNGRPVEVETEVTIRF